MIIYYQLQYIQKMNPGYDREQVVSLTGYSMAYRTTSNTTTWIEQAMQNIKNELQSYPYFASVAMCSNEIITGVHLTTDNGDWNGRPESFKPMLTTMGIDADYHNTLGLELVEGRWFTNGSETDKSNVILNETAIRELGIREPYIGQRFRVFGTDGAIIGVVKDFHFKSLHEKISPLVFVNKMLNVVTFKTHARQTAQAMQAAKKVWTEIAPNYPFEYVFLDDSFNALYKNDIKTSQLMLIFSSLAIFIALLGLYGLSTFAIELRTKEIGIRKILGASVGDIVSLVSKEFLILVGVAMLIAFPLAYYWANKFLQDFAYRINIGWRIFALAGIITIALTLLTVGWKAVKAATANPVNAIKTE